ncbi:hypothetical protein BGZ94_005739, partial [Podila epigama]
LTTSSPVNPDNQVNTVSIGRLTDPAVNLLLPFCPASPISCLTWSNLMQCLIFSGNFMQGIIFRVTVDHSHPFRRMEWTAMLSVSVILHQQQHELQHQQQHEQQHQ